MESSRPAADAMGEPNANAHERNGTASAAAAEAIGSVSGRPKMAMKNISADGKNWVYERHRYIPLYLPNIIGYLRIIFTAVSITLAFTQPRSMLFFYFISFVCDELDGRLARKYSQQSTFGAVLDMVTDRLSTAALLGVLAVLYPFGAQICIFLQALDIASHWCHMYYSLVSGGISHKELSKHQNWLVRSYYANRIFMGTCCVSCEVLYLSLYALHWPIFQQYYITNTSWRRTLYLLNSPFLSGEHSTVSLPLIFLELAIPGFIIKQAINVIQLVHAMQGMCLHDLKTM